MKFLRRGLFGLAAGAAAAASPVRYAFALDYPARPVHMIVDIPAGLAPDVVARLVAPPSSARLGQQFVVENKPGAGGNVGAAYVVCAAPDGYTLLVMISGNAASAALYPNLDFDFVRDITAIAFLGYTPFVVVESIGPGKDAPRTHRLRQGQSGQAQLRLTRRRHRAAPGLRVVQDDHRR